MSDKETKYLEDKVLKRISMYFNINRHHQSNLSINEVTGLIWTNRGTIHQGYAIFYDEDGRGDSVERCYTLSERGKLHSPVTFMDGKINQDADWDFSDAAFYLSPFFKREWAHLDIHRFKLTYKLWCFLTETGLRKNNWPLINQLPGNKCHFCLTFTSRSPIGSHYCPLAYGFACTSVHCCKYLYSTWLHSSYIEQRQIIARHIKDLIGRWLIKRGICSPFDLKEMEVNNNE